MVIVDAQVHPWSRGESTGHHRRTPIDCEVLLQEMELAGVDKVVLVPPLWDPDGNRYALSLAGAAPDKFTVMGLLDPADPGALESLEKWHDQPGMRGVRFLFNSPERAQPLHSGVCDPLWVAAERLGITVAMLAPGQLSFVGEIAARHPEMKLIVDHLAVPRGASGPSAFRHLPQLLDLAKYRNVHVKAVGVGDYALDPFPFVSLLDPLKQVFDAFGADRVIWGSDLSRLHHPYVHCVDHFLSHLSFLDERAKERVMGKNILEILEWR